jgi:branched-chain amino acid transport system substrate-binding protein
MTVASKRFVLLALFIATATTSTLSCGHAPVVVNGVKMDYEDGAKVVYEEGKDAQKDGDTTTAKARYRDVLELFPDSKRVPEALGELAYILFEEGGCTAARSYLEQLASDHPLHARGRQAKEKLAECDGGGTTIAEQPVTTYDKDFDAAASSAEKKDVASRAADGSIEAGDYTSAVRWLLKVRELESDPATKSRLEEEISELIDDRVDFRGIRQLHDDAKGSDFPKPLLTYKLGRVQYHARDLDNAKETLEQYLSSWPTGPWAEGAKGLIALIEARGDVKPNTIGVLLPLTGRHRSYGELGLQAIKMAFEGSRLQLVVRDTKSDSAVAGEMMQELALKEGAIAVIGPLFAFEAEPAGAKAQQLGVPLMTISVGESLAKLGPYVFRNGLTNKVQAEALVRWAMEVEGMKRFAILYPRHPYGEELLHHFWDEVEKRKGEIRGVESYSMGDTTFTWQVKRLVARDQLGRSKDFHDATKECEKQPDAYRRNRCKEDAKKSVKPVVDFDALFIPDYYQNVSMITAALAVEDIIVEKDPRRLKIIEKTLGREVEPVTLLGASGWYSTQLIERSERNVENAVFTEAFFAEGDDKRVADFVREYTKKYGREPRLYPEALLYDSARMFRTIAEQLKPPSREAFRAAVKDMRDFPGVTGKISFINGTDAERTVKLIRIKNGKFEEIPAVKTNGDKKG